jgi:CRISPR/Cas system-associated exonuclease Cas4 (RecB family)
MSNLREVIGDELYVSITQLKTWMLCPRQFELRYVRGVQPENVPKALAFGTSFHGALARYYIDIRDFGTPPPVEKLIETFVDLWKQKLQGPVPVEGADDEDEGKGDPIDLAAKMLRKFNEEAKLAPGATVEAIELPFSIDLLDPDTGEILEERLVGVIDLVLKEDGHHVLVEHKSSAKKYAYDQLRHDFQPTAYQIAVRDRGWNEVGLRYQVVTKTKSPQVQIEDVMRDAADESDFRRLSLGVLKAIDAGVSYPVRSWACKSCSFKAACSSQSRRAA